MDLSPGSWIEPVTLFEGLIFLLLAEPNSPMRNLLELNYQCANSRVNLEEVGQAGHDDSEPFVQRKVPTIMHSLTQDSLRVLDSREDKLSPLTLTASMRATA